MKITIPDMVVRSSGRDAGNDLSRLLRAALDAVEPGRAVRRHLRRDGDGLFVGSAELPLGRLRRIRVLGGGKASQPMAGALWQLLGERLDGGIVVVKKGEVADIDTGPVRVLEGDHPVPDKNGAAAAERLLEQAVDLDDRDLGVVVITGGASSLLTLPAPGVGLNDLRRTTDLLLRSGAPIGELNCVRKHLSRLGGGLLARALYPAKVVSLILSDVVGDPLDVIGSGPTAPDPTSFRDAWQVLERHGLTSSAPAAVRRRLRQGLLGDTDDTPGPGDPVFRDVWNCLVGTNRQAAEAAAVAAGKLGYDAEVETTSLEGEAREVGRRAAETARELSGRRRPACRVFGGETTVRVRGHGKGGRNQELALAAAIHLAGIRDVAVVTLATDGGDGPTDAAGAVVTGNTVRQAKALGLDAHRFLENNDSYTFFQKLGHHVRTGPTHTNVADLLFVCAF